MKGIAQTPYALLAVTLLFMLYITPLDSVPQNTDQPVTGTESAQNTAHNLEHTLKKGLGVTASNYIESANQYVVDEGFVDDAETAIDFQSGEFDGQQIQYTDIDQWSSTISQGYEDRGHEQNHEYTNLDLGLQGVQIRGTANLQYELNYSNPDTTYTLDETVEGLDSIRGPDPLLRNASGGSFTPEYNYCGFDTPARQLGRGSESSGETAHGYAQVKLNEIEPSNDEILVIEDGTDYSNEDLEEFNGVIAEQEGTVESGDYAHVTDISISSLSEGDSIIINEEEVWKSNFRKAIEHNCYLSNSNGPSIFDRMEGRFSGSSDGITVLLDDESNINEPNEAYLQYQEEQNSLVNITGVTSADHISEEKEWFSLNEDNVNDWYLSSLIKE